PRLGPCQRRVAHTAGADPRRYPGAGQRGPEREGGIAVTHGSRARFADVGDMFSDLDALLADTAGRLPARALVRLDATAARHARARQGLADDAADPSPG